MTPVTQVNTADVENIGEQDPSGEVVGEPNESFYDRFHDSFRGSSKLSAQHKEGIGLVPSEPRIISANSPDEQNTSYRVLPIFSGIMIPLSLLLSIPSLTGHWYIRTSNNVIIESRPNTLLLNLATSFSITCVVFANISLVVRFSERYIQGATFLCIIFLSLHDLINIPLVTVFGVIHRFDDGFTYGQPFWMTVCATTISTVTNITLVIDFYGTPAFSKNGSGLTHKQRSLVIVIIILLVYLALGSLVQAIMLNIDFIDALYFSVSSIESIGFGDIAPKSSGSRVFTCFYIAGGILNLTLLVTTSREALLEGAAIGLHGRFQAIRAGQRRRRVRQRWRAAIKGRLQEKCLPLWVSYKPTTDGGGERHSRKRNWRSKVWYWITRRITRKLEDPAWRSVSGPRNTRLNLEALTEAQLKAAASEAGAGLNELLPACFMTAASCGRNGDDRDPTTISHLDNSLHTPIRVGHMPASVGDLALGVAFGRSNVGRRNFYSPTITNMDYEGCVYQAGSAPHSGAPFNRSMTMQDEAALADTLEVEERNSFHARLSVACSLFFVFWAAGSAIFMKTEGWSFGSAAYFCFISFATVGYGDLAPRTPAGRSIFVMWALLGVGTMAILISILSEAYSSQYQKSIKSQLYQLTSKSGGFSTESVTTTNTRRNFGESRTIVNMSTSTDTLPPGSPIPISGLHSLQTPGARVVSFDAPSPRNIQQGWSNVAPIQETNSIAAEALPHHVMRHAEELRALIAKNLPTHGASGVYPVHKLPSLFSDIERSLQDITLVAQGAFKGTGELFAGRSEWKYLPYTKDKL